jgi:hypothetical protein
MQKTTATPAQIRRIGILPVGMNAAEISRLQYFILQMNRLQRSIEYEFTPELEREDKFISLLNSDEIVSREDIKAQIPAFVARYRTWLLGICKTFKLQEDPPHYFIVASMARFDTDYYTTREGNGAVIALGNWERHMAPPTLIEFLLTLVVREAVAATSPRLRGSIHLGTKACICDFTYTIADARHKVLNAFVCSYCRIQLLADNLPQLADEIELVLRKRWVGKANDAAAPATILAKLGLRLFTTKSLQSSMWESFTKTLQEEGAKEFVKGVVYVISALALLLFGFLIGAKSATDIFQ